MYIENFQRFVKETVEQESHDTEVMHSTLDDLMLDTLGEFGIDTKSIRDALKKCWYA